jgi:hypothetical protein
MLFNLATPLIALLLAVPPLVAAENVRRAPALSSSSAVSGVATVRVTTTVTPAAAPTGDTTATTVETSRVKFLTELDYKSIRALAAHDFVYPNSSSFYVCGTDNAVEFDTISPSQEKTKSSNGSVLAYMLGFPDRDTTRSVLKDTLEPISDTYVGKKQAVFKWIGGTCDPTSNYFLAVVDQTCVNDTSVPVQGCEYHWETAHVSWLTIRRLGRLGVLLLLFHRNPAPAPSPRSCGRHSRLSLLAGVGAAVVGVALSL